MPTGWDATSGAAADRTRFHDGCRCMPGDGAGMATSETGSLLTGGLANKGASGYPHVRAVCAGYRDSFVGHRSRRAPAP